MKNTDHFIVALIHIVITAGLWGCSEKKETREPIASLYLTTLDKQFLLSKKASTFDTVLSADVTLTIDPQKTHQKMVGFGYSSPGSVRIASDISGNIPNVSNQVPDGNIVVILQNRNKATKKINLQSGAKKISFELPAGAVGTLVWEI